MKPEDFESRMQESDPARDLTKLSEAELQQIAVAAIAAAPASVKNQKKFGKGLVAAAVAALIAVPALNGAMTADAPPIISLGSSSELSARAGSQLESSMPNSKKIAGDMALSYFWGAYRFELAEGVAVDANTATGYEIQARNDAEQIIKNLANKFKVEGLEYRKSEKVWTNENGSYDEPSIYGYVDGSWASVSYNNPSLDAWAACYTTAVEPSESGDEPVSRDEVCEPEPATNLPSEAEATAIALNALESIGIDASGLQTDVWTDEYTVWVSLADEASSYESYSIGLVDNSEIYYLYASLTEKVALGEYDLLDAQSAIARANEQSDRYIKQMEEDGLYLPMPYEGENIEPGLSEPGSGDGNTDVYVEPEFEIKTVVVTDIKLNWTMNYSEAGDSLWLPVFEFYGYVKGEGSEVQTYPLHSVIAIVDEQIDLDSFFGYGFGGGYPMPLARDMVAID
ncbi:MAG: hypothetical protein RL038_523 [Actinomycetota bacterium]